MTRYMKYSGFQYWGAEFAGPENCGPKKNKDWESRAWKWRTKSKGWKMEDLDNDGSHFNESCNTVSIKATSRVKRAADGDKVWPNCSWSKYASMHEVGYLIRRCTFKMAVKTCDAAAYAAASAYRSLLHLQLIKSSSFLPTVPDS